MKTILVNIRLRMILYGFLFLEGGFMKVNPERIQYTNDFILILWKILLRDVSGIYSISFSFIKEGFSGHM